MCLDLWESTVDRISTAYLLNVCAVLRHLKIPLCFYKPLCLHLHTKHKSLSCAQKSWLIHCWQNVSYTSCTRLRQLLQSSCNRCVCVHVFSTGIACIALSFVDAQDRPLYVCAHDCGTEKGDATSILLQPEQFESLTSVLKLDSDKHSTGDYITFCLFVPAFK